MKSPEAHHSQPSETTEKNPWLTTIAPQLDTPNHHDTLASPDEYQELLSSQSTKRILPYLTVDSLSSHEIAELLATANEAVNTVQNHPNFRNPSAIADIFDQKIAQSANEMSSYSEHKISDKLGEARKLFCASLLDRYNHSGPNEQELIRSRFFSSSPDFASYCGGLKDYLELLTIADRANTASYGPANNIRDEIIYDYSFADFNGFNDVLSSETDPIKQLQLLPTIYRLTKKCNPDGWSSPVIHRAAEAFHHLADTPSTTPLVQLVADNFGQKIRDDLDAKPIWLDELEDQEYAAKLLQRDTERRTKLQAQQDQLHQDFPKLPKNQRLINIAPSIAASINNFSNLTQISTKNGQTASLLDYETDNPFELDRSSAFLLSTAHNPEVKPLIDRQLSLDLSTIPLDSQIQLLKYMTEADSTRYDSLRKTLANTPGDLRNKLAESFLAADFGPDFGDSLLDIANSDRISSEQLGEILDTISSCRASIHDITSLYSQIDHGDFSRQYSRAANERLTDALAVFRQIAKTGTATANLDWVGQPTFDYSSAIEALKYETDSLNIINNTITDVVKYSLAIINNNTMTEPDPEAESSPEAFVEKIISRKEDRNSSVYHFYSPTYGHVLLYTRPEGSSTFDPTFEYGKTRSIYSEQNHNAGIEASISFITNPVNPFEQPNPYRPTRDQLADPNSYDSSTMDKVSAIRLDREGRAPGTPPNDPNRSPINPIGTISVDLAAIGDRPDTPSGKISRLLSVGNKLRQEATGSDNFSLNHNTHWFDQSKYGTTDGFRNLVDYIDKYINLLCQLYASHPANNYEEHRLVPKEAGTKAKTTRRPRRRLRRHKGDSSPLHPAA